MTFYDRMMSRTEWFRDARFGLFLHWGLYTVNGRDCFIRSTERLSLDDYRPTFEEFDPVDYDPSAWARAAKAAGMKYAVLTAKHHDGFCLFDSALTDYTAVHAGAGRDLVREFVDAFRAEGLRVGLYYSVIDWHHPDYPAVDDPIHPMRGSDEARSTDSARDFDRYLDYLHGQVEELCTKYGTIDIFWFDFSYEQMTGETWRASQLLEMVRRLQPGAMVNNRLEGGGDGFGSLVTDDPLPWAGDFVSPEMIIPPSSVVDALGRPVPWETCMTMNNHWGYTPSDLAFKSSDLIIRKLVECVSKGGNLLLNVGPDARGRFPQESLRILAEVGEWMSTYSESIYGCEAARFPKPEWGRYTLGADGTLYAHIFETPFGPLPLVGIPPERVQYARRVRDGVEVRLADVFSIKPFPGIAFLGMGPNALDTYPPDDTVDSVLAITLRPAE